MTLAFRHTLCYNRPMSNFSPTPEQQACIDAFSTGGSMVIDAGAGAGKTTTLKSMSASDSRTGLYLAFNRKTADEAAASFPSNVAAKTGHSLSGQYRVYADRFRSARMTMRDQANVLAVQGQIPTGDDGMLDRIGITRLALNTVRRFCQSSDEQITAKHVPFVPTLLDNRNEIVGTVLPIAQRAWADLSGVKGKLSFTGIGHDVYLKVWALSHPTLSYDYILLDEAQDSNPVIVGLLEEQTCQKIMVGDRNQAIYGWRGAENAMVEFNADHHLTLTQSWRFGQAIADEANKWLQILDAEVNGHPFRIVGNPALTSEVAPLDKPDTILCRTNAGALEAALNAQAQGHSTAIVGGVKELTQFVEAANDLISGQRTWHPDLSTFGSWTDVQAYVANDEGADLKKWVRMIDNYGTHTILEVCRNSVDERKGNPDIIVSTAHKAKGLEWNRVKIAPDFPKPKSIDEGGTGTISRPEAMLSYVAVTRAIEILDNHGLSWVDEYLN